MLLLYMGLYAFSGCFWIIHPNSNPKPKLKPISMVPLKILHGERGWGRKKLIVKRITFRQLVQASTTMVAPRVYCPLVSQGWQPIKFSRLPPPGVWYRLGIASNSSHFCCGINQCFIGKTVLKRWKENATLNLSRFEMFAAFPNLVFDYLSQHIPSSSPMSLKQFDRILV